MASVELSRRVEKVVGYPPLSEMGDLQRREFQEALLGAGRRWTGVAGAAGEALRLPGPARGRCPSG